METAAVMHREYSTSSDLIACPACGGTESVQVGLEATAFVSVAGGQTFRQPAYAIRSCAGCGLCFKSHTLALEELHDLYARLDCETYEHDGNFPTDRFLRRTLEHLPRESKVLDFGCSTGRILWTLTSRHNCFGVEVNEAAAAIARERGIRMVSETQLRAGEQSDFDAIILTDVYEHLPRPVALMEMLAGVLSPDGWLAIVTGSADAIRTRDRIGEFWYFRAPGHLLMASERHLHWLANHLGMHVDVLHRCSHYDTPPRERLRQYVQSFAYYTFRSSPRKDAVALLRVVPFLNRAERWSSAPALTYTEDHVVAVFRNNRSQSR